MSNEIPDVIRTIIDQLGGQRIFAMAFAGCVYSVNNDGETMRPPSAGVAGVALEIARPLRKAARGASKVIVNLEEDDTYTVKLWKAPTQMECQLGRFEGKYLELVANVYADNLRAVVETMTGLRMTL